MYFFSCKFVYSNNVKTNLHKSEIGKEDFTQDIVIGSILLEEERQIEFNSTENKGRTEEC